jgi:phosphoenolpyruvate synthase/pyruvate phosphate dikinase
MGSHGLGEAIVSGEVTPDLFIIDKAKLRVISKKVNKQEWQLIKNPVSQNLAISAHPGELSPPKILR